MSIKLDDRIRTTAFAFRGYNITNKGRSAELLRHAVYGPIVREVAAEASDLCSAAVGRRMDVADWACSAEPSTLDTFAIDLSLIVAMEVAQVRLLREVFDVEYRQARLSFGYSLGEPAALICGGVFTMQQVLPTLLMMAQECAVLAHDVTMGVLFSRGAVLDVDEVARSCHRINAEGRGIVSISSYLAPNTVLLLGQGDTIERFKQAMPDKFPSCHLRVNQHHWPPMHTPLLWEKCIPNRAAQRMLTLAGGMSQPQPPVISLVTGKMSYNDYNSRDLMTRWIDHPQRLWDAVYETLVSGADTVIHVGPEPNLIQATFKRLSDNVRQQLSRRSLNSLGLRAMSGMARRPWLGKLLSSRTALLRAPYLTQVILEDWLLDAPGV